LSAARPVILLVATSLQAARAYALQDCGFRQVALDRYQKPDGTEVQAVAQGSTGFINRPTGTGVILVPGWTTRDDFRDIEARLKRGDLVETDHR
jgi:hypothetical protein